MQPRKGCVPLGERRAQVNASRAQDLGKKSDEARRQDTLPARGVMVTGHGISMRAHLTKSALITLLALGVPACAGTQGDFPSLALRPFENGTAPESPPPPPGPIRPATDPARLAELRAAAASADSAFAARAAGAEAGNIVGRDLASFLRAVWAQRPSLQQPKPRPRPHACG